LTSLNHSMTFKSFITTVLISSVLLLMIAPIGGYWGHNFKFAAAAVLYCLLTVVLLTRIANQNRFWVVFSIVLPVLLIYSPIHFNRFSDTLLSLPSFIAHLIGISVGVLIVTIGNTRVKIFIGSILLVVSFWVAIEGYSMWLNKVNFGSFTGRVSKTVRPFKLYNIEGRVVSDTDFKNKLVVLDFWNTACGVCFEKFPKLENVSNRFQKNTAVDFYSVNIPLKRDSSGYAKRVWDSLPYTVHGLFTNNSQMEKHFGVRVYPTTLIIKNGINVIYQGDIEGVEEVLEKELEL